MKIITLTLNPAFDVHCSIQDFKPYSENLAKITSVNAGGKGINISRALNAGGTDNHAFIVLGEENATEFKKELAADNIKFTEITVKGKIRQNITVHTTGKKETRISFEGFKCEDKVLDEFLKDLPADLSNTVVTFTGRTPIGMNIDKIKSFLVNLKKRGARLVIDSRSFGISDLTELCPWLIKPNEEEISIYTDVKITDTESALTAAERLYRSGIENVMISLGANGAVLYCDEGGFVCPAPKTEVISTIGAGDSSIAGFLTAFKLGLSKKEMLKYAVCYGSAACLTEGSNPPRSEDIDLLIKKITV